MISAKKIVRDHLLFWRITAVSITLLALLGVVFILIASNFYKTYYNTAHQELYGDIAEHLATFTHPIKNGLPDTAVTHDIIHSTMVANPSVEVYLLDTSGNIIDYVVPDKTVKLHRVNVAVVKQWLGTKNMQRPLGDNPKKPGDPSIFSAAAVYEHGKVAGYVYAVLSSEKQNKILHSVNSRMFFRLSTYIFLLALLTILLIGLITFYLISSRTSEMVRAVKRFKEGDYKARIEGHARGDLGMLSNTFNEMADVIVNNFEKISATDKFRQELVANVSHDLRTPLSIMQGFIETLMIKKEISKEESDKYLAMAYDNTKKLSVLVEQLFQFAKLEANLVVPEREIFNIGELTSDILMAYQLKADEQTIQMTIESTVGLSPVFADIALTERVLQNLLDNAIKFTPPGGEIRIQLSEVSSGVKIQISDTGIGISPENQSYIFNRYKQIGSGGPKKAGMGIGLAIVKKILELHQSTIEVYSEVGKGAIFRFVLPFPGKGIAMV